MLALISKKVNYNRGAGISNRQDSGPPMFNLGGNEAQALVNLAKASRTTGQVVAGIKVIQDAFNTKVTRQQITYAMRKAGITPISNPENSWSASDTDRLLQ